MSEEDTRMFMSQQFAQKHAELYGEIEQLRHEVEGLRTTSHSLQDELGKAWVKNEGLRAEKAELLAILKSVVACEAHYDGQPSGFIVPDLVMNFVRAAIAKAEKT